MTVAFMILALLVLLGLLFQHIGTARDMRRFLPAGQLVDVGGHRLHICCTGESTPTVVLDSGFPGAEPNWWQVLSARLN
jgi:hypothetical protein